MLVTKDPLTHTIGCVNWPDAYPDKPSVQFDISCTGDELHLGFRVSEEAARAVCAKDKENIWEDSCVEFFFAPFDDGLYYNFECSCIGRLYLCCGKLTLTIPAEALAFHRLHSFGGLHARGNFYKCGNMLPRRHYLSWAPVRTPSPDFHRPEFFAPIDFQP